MPFAGFEMPVLYTSIIAEHRAVRRGAGLFDVSHMGEIRLRGPEAVGLAERLFTNRVKTMPEGRVRYGLLCLHDGGIIDDVTLLRMGAAETLLCVNASNIAACMDWIEQLRAEEGFACEVVDESAKTGLLALQGPLAAEIVAPLLPSQAGLPRPWRFERTTVGDIPVTLSRTGYSGEDGFELFVAAERTVALWDTLRRSAGERLTPCGLGARDTLRTEMAYPLYGHELDRGRNPLEAGLERFCAFGTGFVGEPALETLRRHPLPEQRVGLVLEGRAVGRPEYPILGEGRVGTVTSGTYGPTVEQSIAIGYVSAGHAEIGARLGVEIRGRRIPCEVVQTPFYNRKG